MAKSPEHIVWVLWILSSNIDNEGADEPASLKEAIARHDWSEWTMAMEREYNSLMENDTRELVSRQNGANIITEKRCFKLKKDRFGHILKYKVWWVAHNYKQEERLDYVEMFVAVIKPMSYKCLFVVGVKRGYRICHIDVVTTFLYGFFDKVIYMKQPHQFATELDTVCKLIKALYGMKKAPHVWYKTLVKYLKKLGFTQLEFDYGIFVSANKQIFITVYVDELLIFGLNVPRLEDVQQKLRDRYKMTDLGDIFHYLGMQVNHVIGEKITLYQSTYLKKILDHFKITECKPASIPMDPRIANSLLPYDGNADKETIKLHQSAIGSLIWPAVYTRPDTAYSVGVLSRYCSNPGSTNCNLVIQIFRYLSKNFDLGITFTADSENELVGYTDSDYTRLIDGRKSIGSCIFMLSGGLLSHQLKLQNIITLSLCKAEYMAITETGKEALWIARFLACLGFRLPSQPVDLRADNKGAILLTENPEFHWKMKNIKVC